MSPGLLHGVPACFVRPLSLLHAVNATRTTSFAQVSRRSVHSGKPNKVARGVEMTTRRAPTTTPSSIPRDFTKRKVAMYVGYDGARYSGFQKNADVLTVSEVLEVALNKAGAIQDSNLGTLSKVSWVVSARTDKGVSAASNCVSFKATFPRQEREDGETALSLDMGSFSERVNKFLPDDVRVYGAAKPTSSFSAKEACGGRRYEYLLPLSVLPESMSLETFSGILNRFEGTRRFHNFTIGDEHRCPPPSRATRYITACMCDSSPLVVEADQKSETFVRIQVQGQSFMLHQIRKMVALAVLVAQERVSPDAFERVFDRFLLTNLAPAPAVGLFLDSLQFDAYNKRFADHLTQPIELDSIADQREAFKLEKIYPSILRRYLADDEFGHFFRTVENHPPHELMDTTDAPDSESAPVEK